MSKAIGIDLGTTNSCVAVWLDGEVNVIANAEGGRTTPSVVAITENGERLVGQLARRQSVTNPAHTAVGAKRLIGRSFADEEVAIAASQYAYSIVEGSNRDAWIRLRERDYSPQEISALVLLKMKQTAEDFLGENVEDAIITVPAHFNDAQRQATRDAGRIAGLNVLRIINEPTAAALAYGIQENREGVYIVYDLGGGTFDVTVLEVKDGVYQVRATSGDTFLGGEDFDRRLVDLLAEDFKRETGFDLHADRMALQRLREAAEKAKHELSSRTSTDVNLPFVAANENGPLHLARNISRQEFETLVADLVERTIEPCRDALRQAQITTRQINEVILVGGMTRMPLVQRRVAEFFGRKPSDGVNPDEVVAVGAAMQGGVLRGEVADVLLYDVTPLSLGVETQGGVFTPLIPRNTSIPVSAREIFTTAVDNQPFVEVHILQGERPLAADNTSLSRFRLVDLPPARRGEPQIEVEFRIDENGIVDVSATDLNTNRRQNVRISPSSGLSENEIQNLIAQAEQNRDNDRLQKEYVELVNVTRGLLYTTERSVEEYGQFLANDDLSAVRETVMATREILDLGGSYEDVQMAKTALEQVAYRLADAIYAKMQAGGGGTPAS